MVLKLIWPTLTAGVKTQTARGLTRIATVCKHRKGKDTSEVLLEILRFVKIGRRRTLSKWLQNKFLMKFCTYTCKKRNLLLKER